MRKFITFLVRKIPRPILIRFSFIFSKIVTLFYKGDNHECPICENKFRKMLPYGNKGAVNRLCPSCLSLERHRLIWLYLKQKTGFFTDNLKVLHIAPEQSFFKRFKALENLDYTTGDLESPIVDIHFDIQNIPFEDNTYDVVMANHVLEHIPDEYKATSELYRILKPGGWAILQVPINPNFKETYEDKSITDPKEREKHFGQYDHLRYHGLDYASRLEKSGFKVDSNMFVEELGEELIEKYRLSKNETLYVAQKLK